MKFFGNYVPPTDPAKAYTGGDNYLSGDTTISDGAVSTITPLLGVGVGALLFWLFFRSSPQRRDYNRRAGGAKTKTVHPRRSLDAAKYELIVNGKHVSWHVSEKSMKKKVRGYELAGDKVEIRAINQGPRLGH